ncbi:hypothetical protein F5Y06DRAFT_305267 [Hypoxylon sp. FL0890]|nr:hypothetical protein F5Y06DRAFT_305267 [Hypoxylon sp. FL0890]
MASAPTTATGAMAESQEPSPFAWCSCENSEEERRIRVKEEALEVGLRHCKDLISKFETFFLHNADSNNKSSSTILGREALEKWIQDCKHLIDTHKEFRVLVGVAGPTGSGKTSALNALLGFPELLPTSNQEAATAVPCKVAYNDDDRHAMKFRACVTFRKLAGLRRQLDQFFEDLKRRDELLEADTGSPEDFEALRDANASLKPTFEMARTVFGLEECEVSKMTTEDLLSDEGVTKLLGTKKKYHSPNADQLSEQIKPYMDSTTARHTKSGSEFAAWPLIDEVEILVKSDILRNGVVLVDLPGLADSVESRAAVAEAYFSKLVATLIVSPARRAADDSTSVRLMSEHQELRMKMDGKFHKRSYCIVVSQMDQIDRRSALRTREAKSNPNLQQLLEEEEELKSKKQQKSEELKNARKQLAKLHKASQSVTSKAKKSKMPSKGVSKIKSQGRNKAKIKAQQATIATIEQQAEALEKQLNDIRGHIIFLCVKDRNKFLDGRIQQDFERRQAVIASNSNDSFKDTYDGRVSICPISAKAFWQSVGDEEPVVGFPNRSYSGIPNLLQWIRTATIQERESHANSLLRELHHHFNVIQTWSKEEWGHSRLHVDRKWVEEELFPPIYDMLEQSLKKHWSQLKANANKLSPLKDQKVPIDSCVKECRDVVRNWSYKDTGDNAGTAKIHWITYQANIQRKGGKFISRSGEDPIEYNWMEDISNVLLKTIVADWNKALNHDIPKLAQPAHGIIDSIWTEFLKGLRMAVDDALPDLLPFLEDVMPNLGAIKEQVKDKMRRALKNISKDASDVPADMVNSIQKKWLKTFSESIKKKGKGSFKERQAMIADFAQSSGRKMFNAAFYSIRKQLSENFEQLPSVLEGISKFAVQAVQDLITVLLNNVILSSDLNVEDAFKEKFRLQRNVRQVLIQWDLEWRVSKAASSNVSNDDNLALPDEYRSMEYDFDFDSDSDSDEMDLDETSTE